MWVPKDKNDKRVARSIPEGDRWYFLEEWYPKYGNLVPRDVATRAIFKVVYEHGMGIDGQPMVYLDLTHLPPARLNKLEGILEIYEKFVGDDPREVPMKIFPGMHYTMGGLWVDFEQQTNIAGGVCGGGGGLLDPWGEPAGGEFPALAASMAGLWRGRRRWTMRRAWRRSEGDGGACGGAGAADGDQLRCC